VKRALLLLLLAMPATAGAEGAWFADPRTGCQVWNPSPQPGETAQWDGACVEGRAEGRGVLTWYVRERRLERDEGEWRAGRQVGMGSQQWAGGRYRGRFADSLPDGEGEMEMSSAGLYRGHFRAGRPDGLGRLESAEGVFEGIWTAGCFRDGGRRAAFATNAADCP